MSGRKYLAAYWCCADLAPTARPPDSLSGPGGRWGRPGMRLRGGNALTVRAGVTRVSTARL